MEWLLTCKTDGCMRGISSPTLITEEREGGIHRVLGLSLQSMCLYVSDNGTEENRIYLSILTWLSRTNTILPVVCPVDYVTVHDSFAHYPY